MKPPKSNLILEVFIFNSISNYNVFNETFSVFLNFFHFIYFSIHTLIFYEILLKKKENKEKVYCFLTALYILIFFARYYFYFFSKKYRKFKLFFDFSSGYFVLWQFLLMFFLIFSFLIFIIFISFIFFLFLFYLFLIIFNSYLFIFDFLFLKILFKTMNGEYEKVL